MSHYDIYVPVFLIFFWSKKEDRHYYLISKKNIICYLLGDTVFINILKL